MAVQAMEAKSLLPALAATAALSAAAVALLQRQQRSPGPTLWQRHQRQPERDAGLFGGSTSSSSGGGWAERARSAALGALQRQEGEPRAAPLAWPPLQSREQRKEAELQQLLTDAERRQLREAQQEMRLWDRRWSLRTTPLNELRALAA